MEWNGLELNTIRNIFFSSKTSPTKPDYPPDSRSWEGSSFCGQGRGQICGLRGQGRGSRSGDKVGGQGRGVKIVGSRSGSMSVGQGQGGQGLGSWGQMVGGV